MHTLCNRLACKWNECLYFAASFLYVSSSCQHIGFSYSQSVQHGNSSGGWQSAGRAFPSNCARQNITQVKGVFRTLFRWTSPSLISACTTNTLENNVACDMPGQIPYMSWLILIMPLSTSMLNCAISFGKRKAGQLFYSNRSA